MRLCISDLSGRQSLQRVWIETCKSTSLLLTVSSVMLKNPSGPRQRAHALADKHVSAVVEEGDIPMEATQQAFPPQRS